MLGEESCSLDPKHASDSSEGAQPGTEISQEQAHDNLNLNWEYNINTDDGMDLDAMENRHAGTSDSEDWSDLDVSSSEESWSENSDAEGTKAASSSDPDELDDFVPDEIAADDLLRVLQERFGDEWQHQLHNLRE
jgi:hypothetical protein